MDRQKSIIRASSIGIIANVLLVIFKMLVGVIAGSIAVILDAVNNLTDVMSSVVTIIGAKLASRRPDHGHPYGHGRSEYLSALAVGVIIFITGIVSLAESIPKIIHPELADYSWATITVVTAAIVIKLALGTYVRRVGKKVNSSSLVASGVDALFDAAISVATLVGIGITLIFHVSIDGILGALISLFIIKTSLEIAFEATGDILGRKADQDLITSIKQTICSFPQVSGAYDLMLHNYGPADHIGSVRIQVPDSLTAKELHHLTQSITQRILTRYGVNLTIGVYAENNDSASSHTMREKLLEIINNDPDVRQMHGFYVDEDQKVVTFDLVVDHACKDESKIKARVSRAFRKAYPSYKCIVTIDMDLEGN